MIGIVLISHGKMAEGMIDSASLFLGDEIPALKAVTLEAGDDTSEFRNRVAEAIAETGKDGDGVIILADLKGGSPYNQAMSLISDDVHLITGMNMTMLLELLGLRFSSNEVDIDYLMNVGKEGIALGKIEDHDFSDEEEI